MNCTLSCYTGTFDDTITFHKDDVQKDGCIPFSSDRLSCTKYNRRYQLEYDLERKAVFLNINPLRIADTGVWSCTHGRLRSNVTHMNVYGMSIYTPKMIG